MILFYFYFTFRGLVHDAQYATAQPTSHQTGHRRVQMPQQIHCASKEENKTNLQKKR